MIKCLKGLLRKVKGLYTYYIYLIIRAVICESNSLIAIAMIKDGVHNWHHIVASLLLSIRRCISHLWEV